MVYNLFINAYLWNYYIYKHKNVWLMQVYWPRCTLKTILKVNLQVVFKYYFYLTH